MTVLLSSWQGQSDLKSLNLIFTLTCETITSLITLRLKQSPNCSYFIWDACVCLWVSGYVSDISGTVIGRSPHASPLLIIPARLWFESANLALISNCAFSASEAKDGNGPVWRHNPVSQLILPCSFSWRNYEASIHTQSLINVKSLHMGCQRAVGGAAEAALALAALWRDVLSVSLIYCTPRWVQSLSPWGGYVGILVCVCVYIPLGD